ncbi:MAG: ribonuclease Z [Candidatus Methanomethylophilaceae archaeon]|nr:ribonuclease Z [Candidatus Methanomethylophilaceae archaeon]
MPLDVTVFLEVVFLGTGASVPTRDRSLPCTAVRRGSDITLFDCGEGSQRQLMCSGLSFMKVERILVSHLHGDHILGIPGLLQTMSLSGRSRPLLLAGPIGLEKSVQEMLSICNGELVFPLEILEMQDGDMIEAPGLTICALRSLHNMESLSFVYRELARPGKLDRRRLVELGVPEGPIYSRLQKGESVLWQGKSLEPSEYLGPERPGRSIAYSGDSLPNESLVIQSKGVDLLIHEATFAENERHMAEAHYHSTSAQAAQMALKSEARSLALTHISSRYKDPSLLLKEAQEIFSNTHLANDFLSIKLPLR